jgi:hypothetical protein
LIVFNPISITLANPPDGYKAEALIKVLERGDSYLTLNGGVAVRGLDIVQMSSIGVVVFPTSEHKQDEKTN